MTWDEKSTRRDGLPRWWPVTQRRIIARDPVCKCPGCIKCSMMHKWCRRASTDADHVGDPTDHRDRNLRGLCSPCHDKRSSEQGNEAKRPPLGRFGQPPEAHPGSLT